MIKFFYCLLFACICKHTAAQKPETEIEQKFDTNRKSTLQEKFFVHTDKDFYLAGEICWFKIYATDAFFHKPIDVSKVAYIELLSNDNSPILQSKIALEKGSGHGSLTMPFTVNSGNYKLRVYTRWMKNFSAEYYFEKRISIVNTQVITALPDTNLKAAYDIQFFPEGGNLVVGLESKVACRVVDQNGKGIAFNASIVNNLQDTVVQFKPIKFGIGSFNFTPVSGQQAKAIFTMPNGISVSKELPIPYPYGYVMQLVTERENQLKISVRFIADQNEQAPLEVYLFAHTRGSVKKALRAEFQNGIAFFMIDKDKLGEGISHLTIFNSVHKPVCERLFFKPPSQNITVKIQTDANFYDCRKKVTLQINAMDELNIPAKADMSVAVYRLDSLQLAPNNGISEYLWLSSDLLGNIESPEYYFDTPSPTVNEAIDNLMLTNGWRRFKWEDILQNKKPVIKFAPEYNGHIITGKVVNSKTGDSPNSINAYLSVPGTAHYRTSFSGANGQVKFEQQHFYGTPVIIVQTNPEIDSAYHVEIDNPFSTEYSNRQLNPFQLPVKYAEILLNQSIGMQVENIYNGDKYKIFNLESIDTNSFYQYPNEIYLLNNYVRFTSMEEVLREYVASVNVRKKGGRFFLSVFNDGQNYNEMFSTNPLVLLDGVPVFNMDKIMQYDPLKVRKLETVTRKYFYGKTVSEGIVNMVTNKGDLEGFELDSHATVIDYEALQLQREFYSPIYETTQQFNSHLPDFRNLLCWIPAVKTGTNGKYQNSFYTADIPGKYVIVTQALTADGRTGSKNFFFEVKKSVQ